MAAIVNVSNGAPRWRRSRGFWLGFIGGRANARPWLAAALLPGVVPRIAGTWPHSLISGAIGLGVMWLLAACAVGVVLFWQRRPPAVLGLRPLSWRWVAFGTGLRGLSDMAQAARVAEHTDLAALRTDC